MRSSRIGRRFALLQRLRRTPAIKLYVVCDAATRILGKRVLIISRSLVGACVTSLEMAGCSITVTLLDAKLTALWDDPVPAVAQRWR
jgi:phosphoenolpyruvate---glycerone phosphotransferase subunit DhaK